METTLVPELVNSPITGRARLNHGTPPRPSPTPVRQARLRWRRSPRTTPCGTSPRRSNSSSPRSDGDPLLVCDLCLWLGQAQRQAGVAAFRETLLDAARRAESSSAPPTDSSRPLWPTTGDGSVRAASSTPTRWPCSRPLCAPSPTATAPSGPLLLATLCSELSFGPLERRRALADEAKAIARRLEDPSTLIRVLCLLNNPLQIPSTLGRTHGRHAPRPWPWLKRSAIPRSFTTPGANVQVNAMQAGDFELADPLPRPPADPERTASDSPR